LCRAREGQHGHLLCLHDYARHLCEARNLPTPLCLWSDQRCMISLGLTFLASAWNHRSDNCAQHSLRGRALADWQNLNLAEEPNAEELNAREMCSYQRTAIGSTRLSSSSHQLRRATRRVHWHVCYMQRFWWICRRAHPAYCLIVQCCTNLQWAWVVNLRHGVAHACSG